MLDQPLRIGLLWHSLTSGNLGVDALTQASLAILREEAASLGVSVTPVVIGMADRTRWERRLPELEFFPIRRSTLLTSGAYLRLCRTLDGAIDIGAGDSFADIYGAKRFGFLWLTKALLVARRKPLLLAPQTIGPFNNSILRRLAAWVMGRAAQVVTRDRESLDLVREIAPTAQVAQGIDVAFELPFSDRSSERGSGIVRIGINISGLLADEARTGRNRFGLSYDYRTAMAELVSTLVQQPDCAVHLFTHVAGNDGNSDDDAAIADEIAARFPQVVRVPDFADAVSAKSFVSSLDFVVAARMHACVAALSSGVPIVPVAYSRKFAGLFGSIGYNAGVPVRGLDEDGVVAAIMAYLADRAALAAQVAAARAQAAERTAVYRSVLRKFLSDVAGKH